MELKKSAGGFGRPWNCGSDVHNFWFVSEYLPSLSKMHSLRDLASRDIIFLTQNAVVVFS